MKASSPRAASALEIEGIATDLHVVAIRLLRAVRQEDAASGLTAGRLSALSVLVFGGRMTLGELARTEGVSLPTMTRIAAGLGKAGYVKRGVDERDRRYVYLEATRRGIALMNDGRRRRLDRLKGMLADLDADDHATCQRALVVLTNVLGR